MFMKKLSSWLLVCFCTSSLAADLPLQIDEIAQIDVLKTEILACIYRDNTQKPSHCDLKNIFSQQAYAALSTYLAQDEMFTIVTEYGAVMTEKQNHSHIKKNHSSLEEVQWHIQTPITIYITSGPVSISLLLQNNMVLQKKDHRYKVIQFYSESIGQPSIVNHKDYRQKNCQSDRENTVSLANSM